MSVSAPNATRLTGARADTVLLHFQVDNVHLGAWDTSDAFEADSEEALYRPGGVGDASISLGGRVTYSNITVSRYFGTEWMIGMYAWLLTRVGKARIYLARYPLTADYVQLGRAIGAQGTLKRCASPEYDSMGNDAALVECECTIDRMWS